MLLRIVLFLAGCAMLAFGIHGLGTARPCVPLIVFGLMCVVGSLFERGRYQPPATGTDPDDEPTGEVFEDPTTGTRMTVLYNKHTGARRYVELKSPE
jgi:hypothetical protein